MVFKRIIHTCTILLLSWSLGAFDGEQCVTPPPKGQLAEAPQVARKLATKRDDSKDDWIALLVKAQKDYIDALENGLEDRAQHANTRIERITEILVSL